MKRIIYILNSYHKNESTHFYHIINFLNVLARNSVEVYLIVEKSEERIIENVNFKYYVQRRKGLLRIFELFLKLVHLRFKGFSKIFVRISMNAALISILTSLITFQKIYYWNSGDNFSVTSLSENKHARSSFIKLKFILFFIYRLVTGPDAMKNYYHKFFNVSLSKIIVLYNDVDILRFSNSSSISNPYISLIENRIVDKKVVLFVHRLTPVKKPEIYIPKVFELVSSKVKDVIYIIIGDGPMLNEVRNNSLKSIVGSNILFLNSIPNRFIVDFYKASHVFTHLSFSEGFPRVVIEAMAANLPIVATNVGGTKDLLGPEQLNFLFDKFDVEGMANGIVTILNDSTLSKKLIKENSSFVQRFSTINVVHDFITKVL